MRMRTIAFYAGVCGAIGFALSTARVGAANTSSGREYHVSTQGNDIHDGSAARPLRTISAAAELARPGDVVTVHQGEYRERINPPRGGTSDDNRIVYRAAPGEQATVKGSEVVKGWQKAHNDAWKATVPNSLFGAFNPYSDLIHGDWFTPLNRQHHTGAVYLNGHWLIEAAQLEDVLAPVGSAASSYVPQNRQSLLNVAWLRPSDRSETAGPIPATRFATHHGIQTAPCTEGGECIGWIEHGDWVRY